MDPRLTAQSARRPGETLRSGSAKEPRTERVNPQQDEITDPKKDPPTESGQQRDGNTAGYGISPSNDDNGRLALAPRDIQNATYLPTAGWPPSWDLYGCVHPAPVLYEASQIVGLGALDYRTTHNRSGRRDIVSRALAAAGAEQVDPSEWLTMNEKGGLYSPMVLLVSAVHRIPTRPVRGHCNLGGPWGVRLGPRARGSLAQRLRDPKKMPPGARKASPREVI